MEQAVDTVLHRRLHRSRRWHRVLSLAAATGLHLAFVLAFVLVPRLMAEPPQPIEYVPVMVVPAPVLGIQQPVAAAEPQQQPEIPAPEPPAPEEPPVTLPEAAATKKRQPEKAQVAEKPQAPRETAPRRALDSGSTRRGSPSGSPTGVASIEAAAVVGLDNPDFTYGYYLDRMLAMIASNWVRPPLGGGVQMMVHFRIQKDGRISDVRISESSGYNSFDLAGLRAVQSASPLPPLPRSYRRDSLGVNLIIR